MKRVFLLLTMCLYLVSCNSVTTNSVSIFSNAKWIGIQNDIEIPDSALYGNHQAPLFRKTFDINKNPDDAQVNITAAGYYTLWINGSKVSDAELSPAWTDYSKRIFYREFDVTELLKNGENVIAVELGNGWYNPLPLRMWGHKNMREHLTIGTPRFIADLVVNYKEKEIARIVSDNSWVASLGSIVRNSIYLGEWHNMELNPSGWLLTDYDDSEWQEADLPTSPGGKLEKADFPPIRKTDSLNAIDIWNSGEGKWTVDFGQNLAGKFKYSGPNNLGDTLIFRMGERIWPDSTLNPMTAVCGQIKRAGAGGPGSPDIAEQVDVFIAADAGDVFEPRYTFHGFRYIEISGLTEEQAGALEFNDFVAYRLGTDVDEISDLESNVGWINQLQNMAEWTLLSNVFSVVSDCPAREKFGYGGDLNATAETWLYNYDAKTIFIKFMKDWHDAMKDDGFVDTAPFVGIEYCGIAWESAYLMIQDMVFKFYGDVELLHEWYKPNQEWINKAKRLLGTDLVRNGLADHEALISVPVELVGSLYYYHSQRVMQKFASITGDASAELAYKKFADDYNAMLVDSLWRNPSIEFKNKQTWLSGLLYYDIIPPEEIDRAVKMLVDDIRSRGTQLTTGIFGTPWMLEVLAKNGQVQLAYELVSRKEFPGWRHMIDNGATTIWETWRESDNVFSQNHPMFSTVSAFFHRWIGGIDPVDGGFTRAMIHPAPVRGIDSFSVSRKVKDGNLRVSWERTKDRIEFELEIPVGVEVIWIPQIVKSDQLESILAPNGKVSTTQKPQIVLNTPGVFKISYNL